MRTFLPDFRLFARGHNHHGRRQKHESVPAQHRQLIYAHAQRTVRCPAPCPSCSPAPPPTACSKRAGSDASTSTPIIVVDCNTIGGRMQRLIRAGGGEAIVPRGVRGRPVHSSPWVPRERLRWCGLRGTVVAATSSRSGASHRCWQTESICT